MDLTRKQISNIAHELTGVLKHTTPSKVLREKGVYYKFIFYMVQSDIKKYPYNFLCQIGIDEYLSEVFLQWSQIHTVSDWVIFACESFEWDQTDLGYDFWYQTLLYMDDPSQFFKEGE